MRSIGSAHMEADGTIILDLAAATSGGTVGDARLVCTVMSGPAVRRAVMVIVIVSAVHGGLNTRLVC